MNRTRNRPALDHRRLDVYCRAEELDALIAQLTRHAPNAGGSRLAWAADQADRASGSVMLNIAEACGRRGADRARMLRIARGSLLELDSALRYLAHRGAFPVSALRKASTLIDVVSAMLARFIKVTGR
jgi:four helix bundle protein